jgi:hypothetical protein
MNLFDCQNLTTAISTIASRQTTINLAINRMQPHDGIVAKEEILEIIKPYHILATFGATNTKFLVEKLGSVEEIQKRIISVPIDGKSATQVSAERLKHEAYYDSQALFMSNQIFKSEDFQRNSRRPARLIETITLTTIEMGFETKSSYEQIIERAEMLGLTLCPPEITPSLASQPEYKPEQGYVMIAMKPIEDSVGNPSVFGLKYIASIIRISGYNKDTLKHILPPMGFVFQIPPHRRRHKTIK